MRKTWTLFAALLASACASAEELQISPASSFDRARLELRDLEIGGEMRQAAAGEVLIDQDGQLRRLEVVFADGAELRLLLELDELGDTDLSLTSFEEETGWQTIRFRAHVELELGRCARIDLFAESPAIDAALTFCGE